MVRLGLIMAAFLLASFGADAQMVLSGHVFDAATKKPVAGAYVYLNNTSTGTSTDSHGHFALTVPDNAEANVIVSHTSYDMLILPAPKGIKLNKFYLEEKKTVIDSVVVREGKTIRRAFGEDRMMKAFNLLFFGSSKAGKSCELLNPEDLNLYYDQEGGNLYANADSPIRFENKYLGYTVEFTLMDFKAEYYPDSKSLNEFNVGESSFYGTTHFIDNYPDDRNYERRRNETIGKSPTYFFKHLIHGTLHKYTPYRMYSGGNIIDPDQYFIITDTMSMKLLTIRAKQMEYDKKTKKLPRGAVGSVYVMEGGPIANTASPNNLEFAEIHGDVMAKPVKVQVNSQTKTQNIGMAAELGSGDIVRPESGYNVSTYDNADHVNFNRLSTVYFFKRSFFVDYNGLLYNPNDVRFRGPLGELKAGDMLPDDYRPKPLGPTKKEAFIESLKQ